MIPYLLAVAGGYLIGNSLKSEKFTDGGMTDSKISDFKKRIKERYGKDGMYAENFSPEPTSKEIDKAVRMFLDWTDSKQKKFNPKDTENVEIVGDIMLYNRGEAFYNLGYEKIVKEILKSVKPQTSKMADGGETHGGMMAKGGGVSTPMSIAKAMYNKYKKNERKEFLIAAGYSDSVANDLSNENWDSLEKQVHTNLARVLHSGTRKNYGTYEKGGITRKKLLDIQREYDRNEDNNYHSENVVLLAKHFGTKEDLKEAKDILKQHEQDRQMTSENMKRRNKLDEKLQAAWKKERNKK